jgi:hypothetical protein
MTNALQLIDDDLNAITIVGPDGQPMTLTPLGDDETLSEQGGGGRRLPRLAVTQNSDDERLSGQPGGTLFLTYSEWAIDEEDGSGSREARTLLIGENLKAYALGFRETRSYFKDKYGRSRDGVNKPACGSADAKRPNPEFVAAGSAPAPMCVGRNPKTGAIVPVCPMAAWTTVDGQRVPPKCGFAVQVGFAAQINGEWMVFDVYFRRTSETAGRTIARQIQNVLKPKGIATFTYPVEIKSMKQGNGRSILGLMRDSAEDHSEEDRSTLAQLADAWAEAQAIAKARALEQPRAQVAPQADPFAHIPDRVASEDPDLLV